MSPSARFVVVREPASGPWELLSTIWTGSERRIALCQERLRFRVPVQLRKAGPEQAFGFQGAGVRGAVLLAADGQRLAQQGLGFRRPSSIGKNATQGRETF